MPTRTAPGVRPTLFRHEEADTGHPLDLGARLIRSTRVGTDLILSEAQRRWQR